MLWKTPLHSFWGWGAEICIWTNCSAVEDILLLILSYVVSCLWYTVIFSLFIVALNSRTWFLLARCWYSTAVSRWAVEVLKHSLITQCCPSARDVPMLPKCLTELFQAGTIKFTYDVFISSSTLWKLVSELNKRVNERCLCGNTQ